MTVMEAGLRASRTTNRQPSGQSQFEPQGPQAERSNPGQLNKFNSKPSNNVYDSAITDSTYSTAYESPKGTRCQRLDSKPSFASRNTELERHHFKPTPAPDASVAPWLEDTAPVLKTPDFGVKSKRGEGSFDTSQLCPMSTTGTATSNDSSRKPPPRTPFQNTSSSPGFPRHPSNPQHSASRASPPRSKYTSLSDTSLANEPSHQTTKVTSSHGLSSRPPASFSDFTPEPPVRKTRTATIDVSRPKAPQNSRNVTPWDYQDPKDPSAPVRTPPPNDTATEASATLIDPSAIWNGHTAVLDPPNRNNHARSHGGHSKSGSYGQEAYHSHTRSKDHSDHGSSHTYVRGSEDLDRPIFLRQTSSGGGASSKQYISLPTSSQPNSEVRGYSPESSSSSMKSITRSQTMADSRQVPSESATMKRSLFDKFRRHRGEKTHEDNMQSYGSHSNSSASLHKMMSNESARGYRNELSKYNSVRQGSVATFDSGSTTKASTQQPTDADSPLSKKESNSSKGFHAHAKFGRARKGMPQDTASGTPSSDKSRNASTTESNSNLFSLDTNLDDMEGIVDPTAPAQFQGRGVLASESIAEEDHETFVDFDYGQPGPNWDAPDSWAVRKVGDENLGRLREIDEAGVPPKHEDDGIPHCVRIFRIDATFATLSQGINTTASEILQLLGRKSFLQDDLDNYQIIMRKHDLHRQLTPGERPIAIQKKLLEQAGYTESDRLEEVGREDNSYLVRFTFVPTKLSGYYTVDKDPGQNKLQKFSHVDLQGRSLITIPITLYQRATEIVSLNLSRNLALDVPKDFIQSCVNLREIRFISNEAWRLPASISLASRLTILDVSNNRLEQLEHADLHKLAYLTSIKLSNNKLKHLPTSFRHFDALRSLNLSSNYLETFPEYLCELQCLIDLDVSFNSIKKMPRMGKLVNLERLWATNNQLSGSLTDQFKNLDNLKEVDVRFNSITSIDVFARLPKLEQLMAGHNTISKFEGKFEKIRMLHLDHNPMTRFDFKDLVYSLTSFSITGCKIAQLDDSCFERMRNVTKLSLDKNHFSSLSPEVGRLQKLGYLSMAKNPLSSLPPTIGALAELRFLDIRECNLKKLPAEIWFCCQLDTLNVSSNVLESFPRLPRTWSKELSNFVDHENQDEGSSLMRSRTAETNIEEYDSSQTRRPSEASIALSKVPSNLSTNLRNDSAASLIGPGQRKPSIHSKNSSSGTITPLARHDSNLQPRQTRNFSLSLKHLYLADNRLSDDVFDEITLVPALKTLNLSYNELYDIPARLLRRWPDLGELYLSGNELTSLPSDDLEPMTSLRVLHINANKFQVLPAELGKVHKLSILDVGSNALKYNVSNWPYDWNWNWNANLRYLNFSGNKRLEIKPSRSFGAASSLKEGTDLTNFNTLSQLRVLGLMDVTLTIPAVPDQTSDRRVRTSGSLAGALAYGMADTLGKHEHLSTIDMVVPRFRGHDSETLLGMFDGQASLNGGSRLAKFLQENFGFQFTEELGRLRRGEYPGDALRRTFLALNKDLATIASQAMDEKDKKFSKIVPRSTNQAQTLTREDLSSGAVAAVAYLDNLDLYIANVGDAQAMLMQSDGGFKILTKKHAPADSQERQRIRDAGAYVSRHGKLNDTLDVSRAFGYIQMVPAIMASPNIVHRTLKESDEMILIASRELWEFLSLDMVVDVARSERGDLMRAAQKLRDLAMAFGASGKIMVMMIGVSDLKKLERNRYRGQSLSMYQSQIQEEQQLLASKRGKKPRDRPDDSTLQRLDPEVEAPTGELALVFTDIKNSTMLWETFPVAMRSAIKSHNEVMRRQLRVIGGYEVKTEGDAFMVAFPTATSALLWCFVVQQHLLEVDWPPEIVNNSQCKEVLDVDKKIIYRGLSVRMGTHWGNPVSELDPITRRMDYFGPMVNRSARISGAADGGEIYVSSDFLAEIHRSLEAYAEDEQDELLSSDDIALDDMTSQSIRKDLRALSAQRFEVKDMGLQKLKGLENPEIIYLMYPQSLAGRVMLLRQAKTAQAAAQDHSQKQLQPMIQEVDTQYVWDTWNISLRLEMICSALENPGISAIHSPDRSVLEKMRNSGSEFTEQFLTSILEHQVTRIETCISTLAIRNMVKPFKLGRSILDHSCPINDVISHIGAELAELRAIKNLSN